MPTVLALVVQLQLRVFAKNQIAAGLKAWGPQEANWASSLPTASYARRLTTRRVEMPHEVISPFLEDDVGRRHVRD